jgi:hypothetical protein
MVEGIDQQDDTNSQSDDVKTIATMPPSLPSTVQHNNIQKKEYASNDDGVVWYKKSGAAGGPAAGGGVGPPMTNQDKSQGKPYGLSDDLTNSHLQLRQDHQRHQRGERRKNQQLQDQQSSGSLASLLMNGDWESVSMCIDTQPAAAQKKQSILLQDKKTTVYPLHLAACVHPPPVIFEKILDAYPDAAKHKDEGFGRFPLHWAVLSTASAHIIEKLTGAYPKACKSPDTAYSRTPLHYLCIYATSVEQVEALLNAPVNYRRVLQQKDKFGKIPMELAKSTNNPIKIEIVNSLSRYEQPPKIQDSSPSHQKKKIDIKKALHETHFSDSPHQRYEMPRSVGSPANRHSRAVEQITSQAQASTFANHRTQRSPPGSTKRIPDPTTEIKVFQSRLYTAPATSSSQRQDDDGPQQTNPAEQHGLEPCPARSPRAELKRPNKFARQQGRTRFDSDDGVNPPPLTQEHRQLDPDIYSSQPFSDEEYCTSYAEKTESFSNNTSARTKSTMDPDRELEEQHEEVVGMDSQFMVDGMRSNIQRLEKSVHQLTKDLRDKHADMDNLESVANDMDLRELDLTRGLQNVRAVIQHQTQEVDAKKARISHLKDKISALEAVLVQEESTLEPMERSILILEQKALDKEQKLFGHRAERKSFHVMKQNLVEERESLSRELQNANSELKSLRAIQDLALGHNSLR